MSCVTPSHKALEELRVGASTVKASALFLQIEKKSYRSIPKLNQSFYCASPLNQVSQNSAQWFLPNFTDQQTNKGIHLCLCSLLGDGIMKSLQNAHVGFLFQFLIHL